jgi:tetratricopeptide (TPR) repeat protein
MMDSATAPGSARGAEHSAPTTAGSTLDDLTRMRVRLNRARDARRIRAFDEAEQDLAVLRRISENTPENPVNPPLAAGDGARWAALNAAVSVELGRVRECEDRTDDAHDLFQDAVRRFAAWPAELLDSLGQELTDYGIALLRMGDPKAIDCLRRAEVTLRRAIEAASDDTISVLILAENLEAQNRRDEAATQFGVASYYLSFAKRFDLALAVIEHACELNPKDASLLVLKGEILRRAERPADALVALDKAMTLNPSLGSRVLLTKAEVQASAGEHQKALHTLERIAPDVLEDPGAWWKLAAELHEALNEPKEAEKTLRELLARRPGDGWTLATLGRVLLRRKQFDEACRLSREALRSPGCPPWARSYLVFGLCLAGQNDEARREAEDALQSRDELRSKEADPKLTGEMLGRLGQVLRRQGELRPAIEKLQQCIALVPNLAWAHAELAEALRCDGQLDEALQCIERALQLDSNDAWAWRVKGVTLDSLNRPGPALDAFDRSLRLDPDNDWARALKGSVLSDLACYEKAIDLLEGATLTGKEAEAWLWGSRAWALEAMGEGSASKSFDAYSSALKLDPSKLVWKIGQANARYLEDRARVPSAAGQLYRQAIKELEPREQDNDSETLAQLGWCYSRLTEFDRSIGFLRRALDLDGELISTRFDLALSMLCAGNTDAAREYQRGLGLLENPDIARRRDVLHVAIEDLRQADRHGIVSAANPALRTIVHTLKRAFDRCYPSSKLPDPTETAAVRFAKEFSLVEVQ